LSGISSGLSHCPQREITLFAFDDFSLPLTHHLQLSLTPAEKFSGNPVLRHGRPGDVDEGGASFYGTVILEGDLLRMWYLAFIPNGYFSPGSRGPLWIAYAESRDGVHWKKPSLGLVEWKGSKENNIVWTLKPVHKYRAAQGSGDPHDTEKYSPHTDYPAVILDPEDPDPSRRYKMVHVDYEQDKVFEHPQTPKGPITFPCPTLHTAVSPDGIHWREMPGNPQIHGKFEASGLYKFNGMYHATGQQFSPWTYFRDGSKCMGRTTIVYRSPDFERWEKGGFAGFDRTHVAKGEESHMGPGILNKGNVLVGLYGQWHDADTWETVRMDIGLIVSNDGLHFREPVPSFKFLAREEDSLRWEPSGKAHRAIVQGNGIVNFGERTCIWYSTWDVFGNIGMATLPRERFGQLALRGDEKEGYVLSCPLDAAGKPARLFLNVSDLSPDNALVVEVNDACGRPLGRYCGDECIPVTASGFRVPVRWKSTDTISAPGPFSLRVHFSREGGKSPQLHALYVSSLEK